jgi:lactoylglutathione lyase
MRINLVVIKTRQPENLAEFYQRLGIKFDHHKHGNGPMHVAAEMNDVVFEIYPLPKEIEIADNTIRLGFTVDDLDGAIENLKRSGAKIIKDPALTEWGYQALIEDPDGRKVELKAAGITVARYQIEETFRITNRGLVIIGTILNGVIHIDDEIIFTANGSIRNRLIKGIDAGMRRLPITEPAKVGLMLECINENEVDELRQWKPEGQIALIKNNKQL